MQRAPKRSLHGRGRLAQGVRRRMASAPTAARRHMLGASLPISGGTCNVLQPRRVYSEAHAIAEMQRSGDTHRLLTPACKLPVKRRQSAAGDCG